MIAVPIIVIALTAVIFLLLESIKEKDWDTLGQVCFCIWVVVGLCLMIFGGINTPL